MIDGLNSVVPACGDGGGVELYDLVGSLLLLL